MTNVMSRAWEIAKEAVTKFGGSSKEYFAEALKMAWAEKKQGPKTIAEIAEKFEGIFKMRANVWEKHNMRRIYLSEGSYKIYFQFNTDNTQITKFYAEVGYDLQLRGQTKAVAELFNSNILF